ncbi:MAG: hypothetical protein PWQ12_1204 [Clostridiales bacterium]|nr:hypothetical protein [Clostridiales bacterium]
MFRNVKIKIIVSIMSILLLVFAGTLVSIYFVSYRDVLSENLNMMAEYADNYEKLLSDDHSEPPGPESPGNVPKNHDAIFGLTRFYSVDFGKDGTVIKIENENSSGLSDEELTALASDVSGNGDLSGSVNHMLYLISDTNRGQLIVFMNNTIADDSFTTLFRYTLLFGGGTMILLFFFSYFLAGRIVHPIKVAFEKQKQFVSDASHELKTPLSVINANAEMLTRDIGENKWLSNIQSENGRMAGLVNQLLQLAKSENGNVPFIVFDLSRAVTGDTLPFESLAFEQSVELKMAISEGIKIWGNEEQIGQVLSILIDNALNHTTEKGTVQVMLKRSRNNAVLQISNTGEPIPPEKREVIFERFYRLDEARSRTYNRYGLGLSIAKAIVTEHRGKISVDCANGWTTFSVTLPIRSQ